MKILVTGANGFVGATLRAQLAVDGMENVAATRQVLPGTVAVGNIDGSTDWRGAVAGCDAVVHLAARTQGACERALESLVEIRRINIDGTASLVRQAADAGVKRFIFVSSLKVHGEERWHPYCEEDRPCPEDAYGVSKWEAEQIVLEQANRSGMEPVILRPPLVYGPGVKGNFLRLMQAVDNRIPLPLGSIRNRRSLIYLNNLVDVIRLCLVHPAAAGKTFLISDGDDVSTPELIRRLAEALGRSPFLLPVPVAWMKRLGTMLGKRPAVDRLTGSLTVDLAQIQKILNWKPPFTMQAGLAETVDWFRKTEASL